MKETEDAALAHCGARPRVKGEPPAVGGLEPFTPGVPRAHLDR